MGARVGRGAFVSFTDGGLREIDGLEIGEDAVVLTHHLHGEGAAAAAAAKCALRSPRFQGAPPPRGGRQRPCWEIEQSRLTPRPPRLDRAGHFFDHNSLQNAPLRIGRRARLNTGATMVPLACLGDGSTMRALATSIKGQVMEPGRVFLGGPAAAL
jgi:hypothetical protein